MNNRRLNKIRRKIFAKPQHEVIRVRDCDVVMTPTERRTTYVTYVRKENL